MRVYSTNDLGIEINSHLLDYKYNWLRITGGEPFLNLKRGRELCSVLKLIEGNGPSFRDDVVIQTNGFLLANPDACSEITTRLADLSLDVLIEISLKGTCREEFKFLTQLPQNGYDKQLEAAKTLERMIDGKSNLAYRLIMGFGPNKVSNHLPSHVLVHPKKRHLLQMKEKWDADFTQLYERYLKKSPTRNLGFSMACLVTQRW